MADLDKIMTALRNAHAAGDTAAAKRLAAMAKAAQDEAAPPAANRGFGGGKAGGGATGAERSTGQALYDNLVGDPNDGVDSYGEQAGRVIGDVAKAGAAGVARGVAGLAGLPGTVGDLVNAGLTRGGKAIGILPDDLQVPGSALSSASLTGAMSAATGGATDFKGETTAGKYAGTVGEFLPGAAAFGGISPTKLLQFGVVPGVASEAAGQAAEGTGWETAARIGGALAGGILPGMAAKGLAKAVSPYGGADPERLKLAKVLEDFGVPITAGQKVGSEALRRKEALTTGGQEIAEAQREAFTRAALKTAGTDAPRATADVLADTAKRIGAVFDDVTRGVDVTPDPAAITNLSGAVNTYKSLAPTGNQAPLVSNVLKDVVKAYSGGNPIPAATVNTWRSGLSKLTTSADAATREAAQAALETIDDMLTAALNATGRSADVARLATARSEWRNFLAIQKAATGAGENAAAGLLSPSALRNAIVQQGRAAFGQGRRGDIGDLARAGEGVMKALPDSGTPAGLFARVPPGSIPATIGAALGSQLGPYGAAAGAAAGLVVPGIAGAVRMSGPVQAYLANQVMPNLLARPVTGAGTALLPFAGETRNALRP